MQWRRRQSSGKEYNQRRGRREVVKERELRPRKKKNGLKIRSRSPRLLPMPEGKRKQCSKDARSKEAYRREYNPTEKKKEQRKKKSEVSVFEPKGVGERGRHVRKT